jgi:acyl carrier protein
MTRQEAFALVEGALNEAPGTISDQTRLDGLDTWDSVGMLSVMAAFDERFSVVAAPEQLAKCKTGADLLDLVKDKLN